MTNFTKEELTTIMVSLLETYYRVDEIYPKTTDEAKNKLENAVGKVKQMINEMH